MGDKAKIINLSIKTGKRYHYLYDKYLYYKNEFNITINDYLDMQLYSDKNDDSQIEIISNKVSQLKGITKERAEFKIKQIKELLNIEPIEYYRNSYYDYTNYHLITGVLCKPKDKDVMEKITQVICLRMNIPNEDARKRIEHICSKFHLTYKTVMFQCFYKCTDRQIREKLDRIRGSWEGSITAGLRYIANREGVYLDEAEERVVELKNRFGIDSFFNKKYFKMSNEEIFAVMDGFDEIRMNRLIENAKKAKLSVEEFCYNRNLDMLAFGISKETYNGLGLAGKSTENINSFIIDSDMRYLMTKYNMSDDMALLDNKIKFAKHFEKFYGRLFWENSIGADYESFLSFLKNLKNAEIIVKPVGGLAGKGIRKFNSKSINTNDLYKKIENMGNVIVEECITQHEELAAFGKGAVNSMRVLTIYENGRCNIIYAFFRVGIKNDIVDNLSQGGYISRINIEKGLLESNGHTIDGKIYIKDPISNKKIKGTKIPYWKDICNMLEKSSESIKSVGLVGWDVAVSTNGPVLIEGNSNPLVSANEYAYQDKEFGHRDLLQDYLDEFVY